MTDHYDVNTPIRYEFGLSNPDPELIAILTGEPVNNAPFGGPEPVAMKYTTIDASFEELAEMRLAKIKQLEGELVRRDEKVQAIKAQMDILMKVIEMAIGRRDY